jgi:hypothetical protein
MLTIKAEIQKDKLRQDGSYNVRIRFTKDRKVKRLSTSLFATKDDLTDKFVIRGDSLIRQEADRLILHYFIVQLCLAKICLYSHYRKQHYGRAAV